MRAASGAQGGKEGGGSSQKVLTSGGCSAQPPREDGLPNGSVMVGSAEVF